MSDIGTTAPDAGQPGATPPSGGGMTTQTAPVTPPAPPAAPADVFAEPDAAQAVFDRGYVERLRREGARYRTEHQSAADQLGAYERVFGVYDPADRQVWMDLASTWANDPGEAARMMNQIAQAVLQPAATDSTADGPTPQPGAETADEGGLGNLTPDQVQQMIAEAMEGRERAAAEQRAVDEVYSEIRAAGFDPSTKEGFMVLWLANNGGQGDIQAGIKEMQAWKQGIIDEFVAGRTNGHHPTPSPNGAVATTQPEVHDLRDARRAAQAFIESQIGASSG